MVDRERKKKRRRKDRDAPNRKEGIKHSILWG